MSILPIANRQDAFASRLITDGHIGRCIELTIAATWSLHNISYS